MAKKNRAKFPKRIAGVKIPKQFRRFADSPVGSDLVAAGVVFAAYKAATSETATALIARVREEAGRADAALHRFADKPPRREFSEDYRDAPAN